MKRLFWLIVGVTAIVAIVGNLAYYGWIRIEAIPLSLHLSMALGIAALAVALPIAAITIGLAAATISLAKEEGGSRTRTFLVIMAEVVSVVGVLALIPVSYWQSGAAAILGIGLIAGACFAPCPRFLQRVEAVKKEI